MTTIYELSADYEDKLTLLGDMLNDDQVVSTEQAVELLDLQDDISAKVVNIGKYVKNLTASSDGIAKEIARLTAKKRGLDNHAKSLKDAALSAMCLLGVDRINDDIMPVRLQANSQYSVSIENIDSLPDKYKVISYAADKKALLADRDKIDLQGVTIKQGQHIRFG